MTGAYFYMSFAPTPTLPGEAKPGPDALVHDLFRDLRQRVAEIAGVEPDDEAGFCRLEPGRPDGRKERLSQNLARCRVLVPLYSPRYFGSETCGRELAAFRSLGPPDDRPIVPALWAPSATSWPPAAAPLFHPDDADLDGRYSALGLYGFVALRPYDDGAERDYQAILGHLSTRIVASGRSAGTRPGQRVDLDRTPSAFTPPTTRPRLSLLVLAPTAGHLPSGRDPGQYGETALDWNPYGDVATGGLVNRMIDLARNLDYTPEASTFDDALPALLGAEPPRAPAVLVIDPWALEDPTWRTQLEAFDALDQRWAGVVVAWNPYDVQTAVARERLMALIDKTLAHRFAQRRVTLRLDARVASTSGELAEVLIAVVQESAVQYLKSADVRHQEQALHDSLPEEPETT